MLLFWRMRRQKCVTALMLCILWINITQAQQPAAQQSDFENNINQYINPSDPFSTTTSTSTESTIFISGSSTTTRDPNNFDYNRNSGFYNRNNDINDRNRYNTSPNRNFDNAFGINRGRPSSQFPFDQDNRSNIPTYRQGFVNTGDATRNSFANPFGQAGHRTLLDYNANNVLHEITYFIVSSRMVRPGHIYRVSVQILRSEHPVRVRGSISRDGVELTSDGKDVKEGVPETLLMRIPTTSVSGQYKLRIEGIYADILGGLAFLNETRLTFSQRSMTIFVQTDKPVYMQGDTVNFRVIPITTELRGFDNAIDVYILDPNKHILKRWLSRQSNLGTVSLEYKLSDLPVYGDWIIRVIAQGQIEESKFSVEEYYQTRFEVNVTMPAFFFNSEPYIHGKIMANFTSGAPVKGNLTIKATLRPIGWYNTRILNQKSRVGNTGQRNEKEYNPYFGNQYGYQNQYGVNLDSGINQNQLYQPGGSYQEGLYSIERYYNFDEEWPFWIRKPDHGYNNYNAHDRWSDRYRYSLPYLRYFNGTFEFKYPMYELEQLIPNLSGMEVLITATVGERYYDEVIQGYALTRIYNSTIKAAFLGGTPQVFKPSMPFSCFIAAEYHDGSPLPYDPVYQGSMEVTGVIDSRGGRRDYPLRQIRMSEKEGIWELKIDLRNELQFASPDQARDFLNGIENMLLTAVYIDERGERAVAELLLLAHHSPENRHLKVSTSTNHPRVGEYIILHIQGNFFMETFNYLIISKGLVLLTGQEVMQEGVTTMSITLSAEMAPVATIIVWHIGLRGTIIADSLTFPVNGISRNKFTVFVNNKKSRTGEKVEVAIYGEPGSYVGLSGIDNAFYTMQAGNELTYAHVISKMATFDEQTNGTFKHSWYSHSGEPDELVYYPSPSFGMDANRTFEYSGIVVFTDGTVPRKPLVCNHTLGDGECLNGDCYRLERACDGVKDCKDGTDEINCGFRNETALLEFRKFRFNRIKRHYENVWLWRDVNIGPHGRFIFTIDVPAIPAYWMISAFSISQKFGYGMINKAIEYTGVLPFFINVEMPTACKQGEQVGIRVTVFNYMTTAIEATVVLHGSPDYKFVHVEENGIVRSYNPRTSFGEHQFFIYLEAADTSIVYLPIVPQRLGEIEITVHAATLLGKDVVTRKLRVESDGLPQHRHQSILLDLSNRAYVFQYMHVNVTETPIIPYDADRYYVFGSNKARISVVGDVVGPIFPTMPVNATSLLHLPMDCAEQNMFSFASNLYTIMYMRLINQRNRTTEKHAFNHMNIGYQRQLSFLQPDGSFSLFRSDWNTSASSVWLTAYCARVFQEASFYEWENFIYIDPLIVERAVYWLLQHQTPEGAFYEVTWSPDRKMNESAHMVDDHIRYRNISLTAHVLITLVNVRDLSGTLGARVALAQQLAIRWLDRNMQLLEESGHPYEIAITAYALMLSKSSIAEQAFRILTKHSRVIGEYVYWGNDELPQPPTKLENQKYFSLPRLPYEYDSLNIETTSYALMTYVSRRELFVDPIVRWIVAQRLTDGGWASTQDSGVALKALIEYTIKSRIRDVSQLSISIESTSLPGETKMLYITDKNLAQLQSIEIPNAWGTVKVQAKGAGFAILQMHVQYNVDIKKFQTQPPVKSFDLVTNAQFHGRNQSHITYVSCQKWTNTNESIRSGMAVLDVAIPTGYWLQQQKLDAYILSRKVRNLQRARYQEDKVLFFFDYLDHEPICINFTIERWFPVANMSRYLPIRVYDYYAPERFNESIFDALPTYLLNICEVCGSSQCPYCSIYNLAVKSPASIMLIVSALTVIFFRHTRLVTLFQFSLRVI